MTYDFDRLVDRRHTDSSKWQKYGPDIVRLWVADMDFQSPEPVIRALRERVEHGVFGYLALEQPEFHELFADRLLKRYGWRVSPDAVVLIPGVIPGFNVAGRILAAPGDGLILQTPVYPPILRAASSIGLTREEAPLARQADGRYAVDIDAFAAYRDGQPWLDGLLRYLEANRDFVIESVRTHMPGVVVAPPEATYLAWLDCRNARIPGGDPFTFFLDKARVALHDGALFG